MIQYHRRYYIKWISCIVLIVCLLFQVAPILITKVVTVPTSTKQSNSKLIPLFTNVTYIIRPTTITNGEPNDIVPHQLHSSATTTLRIYNKNQYHPDQIKRKPRLRPRQNPQQNTRRRRNKHPNHYSNTSTKQVPTILFIHVGKTGGETMKQILNIGCQSMKNRYRKQSCYQQLPQRESQLSRHTHGYYHCYKMIFSKYIRQHHNPSLPVTKPSTESMVSQFDTFLFTIRHPVDRIISWYNYVHPQHCTKYHAMYTDFYSHFQKHSNPLHHHHQQPQQQRHAIAKNNNNFHTTREAIVTTTNNMTIPSSSAAAAAGISCQTVKEMIQTPTGFATTFFFKCFPTIQDWSDALLLSWNRNDHNTQNNNNANMNNMVDEECIRLAQQSIRGELAKDYTDIVQSQTAIHLMANYEHYMNHTVYAHDHENDTMPKKKSIYVVRTEHLWDDLQSIDIQLSGDGDFDNHTGTAITHGVPTRHPTSDHEDMNRMITIFCCALMDEMEQYMYLISHAENLRPTEQQQMMETTIRYCLDGSSTTVTTNVSISTWNDILQYECHRMS